MPIRHRRQRKTPGTGLGKTLATLYKHDEPGQEAGRQEMGKIKQALTHGTLDADTLPSLEKCVAENTETLRLLYEASGKPLGRFSVDLDEGFGADISSHAQGISYAVVLLAAEASLAAKRGEVAHAVESVALQMRMADVLREEPVILSQMVRNGSHFVTCHAVRHILTAGAASDAQLVQICDVLNGAEYPEGMTRALTAERASGLELLNDADKNFFPPPNDAGVFQRAVGTVKGRWLRRRLFSDGEASHFVSAMGKLIDASRVPLNEGLAIEESVEKTATSGEYAFCGTLLPVHTIRSLARDAGNPCARR